jgi:poly-gamma-glutamate synthesis protein (capsule biosynthesis protein)
VPDAAPRRTLTLTVAGDLGLGGHMQPVRADGASKHGAIVPWRELTERIRPLIDGDLNFANLESAVTGRNDLRAEPKTFNFRSHPEGVRHLVGLGFNLLATANNHSMDFGAAGALDTIAHLDRLLGAAGLRAHAGLGRNREEAGRAHIVEARQSRIAFSAIGIVTGGFPFHRAGDIRPGQMAYQSPDDFAEVTQRLAETPAAYRILSVHHGIERQVQTDHAAIRKLRHEAVLGCGIDLVVGHHAHVVQGVEMVDGRVIFYGLGNLLHPGMQNMATFGACRDYGLLARLHLSSDERGHLRVRAIEAVPLTDMHYKAGRLPAGAAAERINVLNYLAQGLDDHATGARGVRFAVMADGSGLHCVAGAEQEEGRIGALCRSWRGPDVPSATQRSRAQASCGYIGVQSPRLRETPQPVSAAGRSRRWADAIPGPGAFGGN